MTNSKQTESVLPLWQDLPAAQSAVNGACLPAASEGLADPRAVAHAMVTKPLDFPPIDQVVVPGDHVTLAVDPNVPEVVNIVAGVVDALPISQLGTVTVLVSEEATEETLAALRETLPESVEVRLHNGDEREELAYLAANEAGDPLYLNRTLTFADFVLPIVLARSTGSLDPSWQTGGLSPALADATSRRRFRYERLMRRSAANEEAAQVAWLLGIQMIVAVTPTVDGQPQQILVGTTYGIDQALAEQNEALKKPADESLDNHDLVLAYLHGGEQQQTWENVGRALFAARGVVRPGGTIAIVTALREPPSGSLLRLREVQQGSEDDVRKRLLKDTDRHTFTATLLLDAQREGRVVLYSQVPTEKVEQLGIGAIDNSTELDHLISEHASCCVLPSAQFCQPGTSRA